MKTKVLRVNDENKKRIIREAALLLRKGEIVAFPTETVYGLGCNALDENAVTKVFKAKGRPSDNPLIVHVAQLEQIDPLVKAIPEKARILTDKFWPGPLTLVFESLDTVAKSVSAGLNTIAIRMPAHAIALDIIREANLPIAAPSANRSGRPSPTSASHVVEDLDGLIPLIVDGGSADIGLESTVLDLTLKTPRILRPGGVTLEMLREVLDQVEVDESVLNLVNFETAVASPGMKHTHYAPIAEMFVVCGDALEVVKKIQYLAKEYRSKGKSVGILASSESAGAYPNDCIVLTPGSRECPENYASNLFSKLREFDNSGVDLILAEGISTQNQGLAVMNRMLKAAGFRVIETI